MNTQKILLFTASLALLSACGQTQTVSYSKQVKPVLEKYCDTCHTNNGEGQQKSGFSTSTHASLLKGTRFGPVITPGNSISSTLVVLIEDRADPSLKMPHGTKVSLTKEEVTLVRNWIDQGAKDN